MFRWLALVALVSCSAFAPPADSQDAAAELNAEKQSVRFDDQTLTLAYEAADDSESIQEFLPAGEKLESWTKLAAIRTYAKLKDPAALAAETIKQLKKDYPLSPSSVIENPKTGEVIVDFVVWPQDNSFVEFNVFRYQKGPDGGILSQQYAVREYQNPEAFLKGLKPVRKRLVELMAVKGLQSGAAQEAPQQQTSDVSQE